ncbi:MAG: dimethylsulfonioproprionate lyase family protein [Thiotrichales bacterium]|nr:dimethylsulfonioproprionate lyase family protein [Thiotrichales bacterium]
MPAPIDLLLSATRTAVRHAARDVASECPETVVLDELLSTAFPRAANPVEPAHTPAVSNFMDVAVRAAATPRERMLASALASASPHLRWTIPYGPGAGADEMVTGYTSTMLSMPGPPPRPGYQAPFANPNVLVAFTLQAPGILYPLHRHKAPEVYYVISGEAEWMRDGETWRRRQPGEWIFHASDQGHAMRTGREPLLALAAWIDHLDCPSPVLEVEDTGAEPTGAESTEAEPDGAEEAA